MYRPANVLAGYNVFILTFEYLKIWLFILSAIDFLLRADEFVRKYTFFPIDSRYSMFLNDYPIIYLSPYHNTPSQSNIKYSYLSANSFGVKY
jgi:hypothetical protein